MSDYWFLIESRFSPAQREVVNRLITASVRSRVNLYLVGGAVRDLTSGHPIRDLDFAVEGKPREILRHIKKAELAWVDYDRLRHCAEIVFSNGVGAEIGMCRTEHYARLGGRPRVRPAVISEDLRRRDFSVNAMAVSLNPNSRGLFLDPNNGVADLERRELRALYNRSFWDAPARIFRLYRLGVRLQFLPEARTATWLERALEDRCLTYLNRAQQGRELREILREDNPARVIGILAGKGFWSFLDKALARGRISRDEFKKVRNLAGDLRDDETVLLNFYCLTHRLSGEGRRRLTQKILKGRRERKLGSVLEGEARKLSKALASRRYRLPSRAYDLLLTKPRVLSYFILLFSGKAALRAQMKNFLYKYPTLRARLPRAEIHALGLTGGPAYEKVLEQIFRQIIDGKVRTKPQISRLVQALVEKDRKSKSKKRKKKRA